MDTTNNTVGTTTPSTTVTGKKSRMELILTVIFPGIKNQLEEEFGYNTEDAQGEIKAAAKLYATPEGAEAGVVAAQAVVDRGNTLLIKEWKAVLEDAVSRARLQYEAAKKNAVSKAILEACNVTLTDVEFLFAPVPADTSSTSKPSEILASLKKALEKVDKVGFALKAENDAVQAAKDAIAAKAANDARLARLAADEEERKRLVEAFLASENTPAPKERSRRQQQLYAGTGRKK